MRAKDPAKQSEILDEALRLFLALGPSSVSMVDIAQSCGIAVGTLYLYFKDKADLALECLNKHLDVHFSQAEKAFASKSSPRLQMTTYLKERFDSHQRLRSSTGSADFFRFVMLRFPDARQREADLMARVVTQKLLLAHNNKLLHLKDAEKDVRVFLLSLAWFFPFPTDEYRTEPKWSLCKNTIHWFFDLWDSPDP